MRRENFFEGVWLRGGEENDGGAPLSPPKSSLQNGEKTWWGENLIDKGQKCPCASCTWASSSTFFFFFFFFNSNFNNL